MSGIAGGHHVFSVEHLLRQLRDAQRAVLLAAAGREWSEARHEEMQTRERNHVDCELAEVCVQLTGEAEACGYAGHGDGDEVVEIAVGRGR